MRELLRELKRMGKTIFFSSHILTEVADVCTSIAILEAGHLVAYGNMAEMKNRLRPHRLFQARVLGDTVRLTELLSINDHVQSVGAVQESDLPPSTIRFEFSGDDQQASQLISDIVGQGIALVSFAEEQGDLEDVFMQVTRGIVS
jgi:ABC-2 type transport system ATP-binding protein